MSIFTIGITFAQVTPVLDLSYALFKTDREEYKIQYNVTNAKLEGTFVDIGARAFMFILNATEDGQLSVELPRKVIDSTRDGKDKPYFVGLGDPTCCLKRIKVDEIRNNLETRIITINFTKGLKQVEILGTFFVENNYPRTNLTLYTDEMSPLKQWQLGADSQEVICKNGFQLIIKARDDSPACVKPESVSKLVDRGWAVSAPEKFEPSATNSDLGTSPLQIKVVGENQVRRGTTHSIEIQVVRGNIPIEGARVFIDIEDYGEDIIKEFDGYTNSDGYFVFSWEIPQSFDDLETLLAFIDVTDGISSKTELFKFQVYCLPGEKNCKAEGN